MSILIWVKVAAADSDYRAVWRARHNQVSYEITYDYDIAMGPEVVWSDVLLLGLRDRNPTRLDWWKRNLPIPSRLAVVTIHDMIPIAERLILTPLERLAHAKERSNE